MRVPLVLAGRPAVSITAVALLMAGCSADVGRFDLNSGVGSSEQTQSTARLPTPSEPLRRGAGIPVDNDTYADRGGGGGGFDRTPAGGAYVPPPSRDPSVRMSGLPDTTGRDTMARPMPPASPRGAQPAPLPAQSAARTQPATVAAPSAAGQTIEVAQGDTLYGLSKRHRVSISELMSANGLASPAIKPGQKLVIPGGAGKRALAPRTAAAPAAAPAQPAVAQAPAMPRQAAAPASAPVATPPSEWGGSYTVAQGDSLYNIARRHKVKPEQLQAANGITDPTKVRPGTVLKVPGEGGAPAPAPAALAERPGPVRTAPVAAQPAPAAPAVAGVKSPTIINATQEPQQPETKVAALDTGKQASDAAPTKPEGSISEPPKVTSATKFRWPVKGKVIANFGPRPDNTHNDGINISVPQGTEVHAAENGVVAYAGNELKGYGNLVLVRHEGNWVSAYAHNDQLMVKRGDKVKRGQAIAKAGATGTVDQPQVHFELRQGSKPVDPMPHMEKN